MVEDDEAERAYQAAVRKIEKVQAEGGTSLRLGVPGFEALNRIPPEISRLFGLTHLSLSGTQISDIAPLATLTSLERLRLNWTQVTDIEPLRGLHSLTELYLDNSPVSDIAPLSALTGLTELYLDFTAISELTPLASLWRLKSLDLTSTPVADLRPLAALSRLTVLRLAGTQTQDLSPLLGHPSLSDLDLSGTKVSDLKPIGSLPRLKRLFLKGTKVNDISALSAAKNLASLDVVGTPVSDLRPVTDMKLLSGESPVDGLNFSMTPATRNDPELERLSGINEPKERTARTLAYLKTLPPWPAPLPWLEPPPPPVPDAGVPLRLGEDGITLGTRPISSAEQDDPIRATLHAVLQDQSTDLIRVAGNIDEAAFRQATTLRDLLEPGLAAMDPLRVHLAVEALRRIRSNADPKADRGYLLALEEVTETGPGLTLDTEQVQLFVDRARRNRLERLEEAEAETQIRLAQSIAESPLSAPDIKAIAERAADDRIKDQFTAIRPTFERNYVLEVVKLTLSTASALFIESSPAGVWITNHAWPWLAANAADLRILARIWGEPFAAWLVPILDRAPLMIEAAKPLGRKPKGDA